MCKTLHIEKEVFLDRCCGNGASFAGTSLQPKQPTLTDRISRFMDNTFLPMATPVLGDRELELITETIRSGWVALGDYIGRFEAGFSSFCGTSHGVAVTSGTSALHLALATLGIKSGDEVIVPALTHIAVANAVRLVGGRLVPVDSEHGSWNLDPEQVKTKLTSSTKAVIAVHLYGHPA